MATSVNRVKMLQQRFATASNALLFRRLRRREGQGAAVFRRGLSSDGAPQEPYCTGTATDSKPPAKDEQSGWQGSLNEPLDGIPMPQYIRQPRSVGAAASGVSRVTTLENGLRVASEPKFGQFCTVGVCIDSGSRYEVAYPSGVSHFLEKLAFGSTAKFDSKDAIVQSLEKYGGICDCQGTRDTFLYAASVDSRGLEMTVDILGEAVLRPVITDDELDQVKTAIRFELEDCALNPMQDAFTLEAIHAAAFSNNTLGLPKICPEKNIDAMSRATLLDFLACHHTPDRMVLAGVGVDHDRLVEAAQKYFVDAKPSWQSEGTNESIVDKSVAQYTGGIVTQEKDLSNASLGPTPFPELAHLVIGLEGVSHQHSDFIAFCVLNMLMGGGGSFSAGGPGKGMYTRLYTHVLNKFHWMYSATAFNHAYADSGIFCISASSPPEMLADTAQVLIKEFVRLSVAGDVKKAELERAKKQLQSMLLMNLESRPVIFEDLARQVLAMGKREVPEHYIDKINQITAEDINRIAQRMLGSKPSIAAIGTLKELPPVKDIELALLDKAGKLPGVSRLRLFR